MTLTTDRLTLGVAALGNLFEEMTDAQAERLLTVAWECGIRSFDTAPHYGLGLSERRLGDFLSGVPAGEAAVSTKVGRLLIDNPGGEIDWDDDLFRVRASAVRRWDFTREGVRRSLTQSLRRLRVDRVRALYLHDPEKSPDAESALENGLAALGEIRAEGLVEQIGVGSMAGGLLASAARAPEVTELMVAGRHTLLDDTAARSVLPIARERGIRVAATAVFNSGLLAAPEPAGLFDYQEASAGVLARARRIAEVCRAHHTDLPTAALHFAARDESVASVVVGMRTPEQIRQNVERVENPPTEQLWAELADEGLLGVVA